MRIPPAHLRVVAAVLIMLAIGPTRSAPAGAAPPLVSKLDSLLQLRLSLAGRSRVIVRATTPQALSSLLPLIQLLGGHVLRQLPIINAAAVDLPNAAIATLA